MTDYIMSEKFYSHREAAWHHLGIVSQEARTPLEVASMIQLPTVEAVPIYIHEPTYAWKVPGYKNIVATFDGIHQSAGGPTASPIVSMIPGGGFVHDGQTKFTYGMISEGYQLVTHQDFVEIWHRATRGAPVETMGLLYDGNTLFITTELPPFSVRGDEIRIFLFGHNPINGKTAIRCRTTTIRVVCHNTAELALRGKTDHAFRTSHVGQENVLDKIEEWLTAIWEQRLQTAHILHETYELLAARPCSPTNLEWVCDNVYPYPQMPEAEEQEYYDWEQNCVGIKIHRDAVTTLFESSHTITPATKGTMFGALNAVLEYEDHGRPRISAMSKVFGESANTKMKAHEACMSLVRR